MDEKYDQVSPAVRLSACRVYIFANSKAGFKKSVLWFVEKYFFDFIRTHTMFDRDLLYDLREPDNISNEHSV